MARPLPARPLTLETLEDRTVPSTSTLHTALGTISYDPTTASTSTLLVAFNNTTKDYTHYSALAGTEVETSLQLLPGYYLVQVSPGVGMDQALTAYADSGLVRDVSPDYLLNVQTTPNDPQYAGQWSLNGSSPDGINASSAWSVARGSTKTIVSVMDTGIDYNHVDLYQNIWINQGEIPASRRAHLIDVDGDGIITFRDLNDPRNQGPGKITDINHDGRIDAADILAPMIKDKNGNDTGLGGWATGTDKDHNGFVDDLVGWNFVDNNNKPMDDNGHGTHVSGIIGASGNNGTGVTGINWVTQLMDVKFMNANGEGSIGSFIAGLDYAVANGAKISNNSWAGGTYTSLLYDAINNARAHGHIFVAAAGNAATNIDVNPSYPASYQVNNVVVVASSSRTGTLSSFSNYGIGTVKVAAPGEGILSTLPGNQYGTMSGTSMAAPEVTGTLALIWSQHPNWTYTQVINQMLATVHKVSALNGKVTTSGIVDAAAAVGASTGGVINASPRVLTSVASGTDVNTINRILVTFDEPVNPATMNPSAIKLIGPSGKLVTMTSVKAIADSGNRKWMLNFLTQNVPGTYSLQVLNTVKDMKGKALAPYYTTFSINKTATYANKKVYPIPDVGTATSPIFVNQNATVDNIAVKINLQHTFDGDLAVYLVSPDGHQVALAYRMGGSGDNFVNTVFADSAGKSIADAKAPFTGTFQPAQPLSNFHGLQALGNWKLVVKDLVKGDVGKIISWSMTLTTNTPGIAAVKSTKVASVEGFADEAPAATTAPASLTTTVSGPGLVSQHLVSALGDVVIPVNNPGMTATPTPTGTTPQGWLARDLAATQSEDRRDPAPVTPHEEEEFAFSDAVFQQATLPQSASSVLTATSTPAPGGNQDLEDPMFG
jgi:subtilisin family serine protease/subtilisin-like proprotein convertase family protein